MSGTSPSQAKTGLENLALIAGAILFVWWCFWIARGRLVALDEGFYLYAAKAVLEGAVPYRDFFYTQMPLSPYLLALWNAIAGVSYESGRSLSAALFAGTGLVLGYHVRSRAGSLAALLALLIFGTSSLVFPWYAVAKTYAPSVFFVVLATVLALRGRWALAGLCLGLSVESRLFFCALVPVFFLEIARGEAGARRVHSTRFLVGFGAALVPALVLFLMAPDPFVYGNLGYHMGRSQVSAGQDLVETTAPLTELFGLRAGGTFAGAAMPVLLWACGLAAAWAALVRRRIPDLPTQIWLVLFVTSLLPRPSFTQYFCVIVPFLLLAWIETVRGRQRLLLVSLVALGASNLLVLPGEIARFTRTGGGVEGFGPGPAPFWTLRGVEAMGRFLADHTPPGEPVLSWWPGFLVEADRRSAPRFENHFSRLAAQTLSPEEQERYRIGSAEELVRIIEERRVCTIALGGDVPAAPARARLAEAGYSRIGSFGPTQVFRCSGNP